MFDFCRIAYTSRFMLRRTIRYIHIRAFTMRFTSVRWSICRPPFSLLQPRYSMILRSHGIHRSKRPDCCRFPQSLPALTRVRDSDRPWRTFPSRRHECWEIDLYFNTSRDTSATVRSQRSASRMSKFSATRSCREGWKQGGIFGNVAVRKLERSPSPVSSSILRRALGMLEASRREATRMYSARRFAPDASIFFDGRGLWAFALPFGPSRSRGDPLYGTLLSTGSCGK